MAHDIVLVDIFDVGDVGHTACASLGSFALYAYVRWTLRPSHETRWGVFSLDARHAVDDMRAALARQGVLRSAEQDWGFDPELVLSLSTAGIAGARSGTAPLQQATATVASRRLAVRRAAASAGFHAAPHMVAALACAHDPSALVYAWVRIAPPAPWLTQPELVRLGPQAGLGGELHAALCLTTRSALTQVPPEAKADLTFTPQDGAPTVLAHDFVLEYPDSGARPSLVARRAAPERPVNDATHVVTPPSFAPDLWASPTPPRCGGRKLVYLAEVPCPPRPDAQGFGLPAPASSPEHVATIREVVTAAAIRRWAERYSHGKVSRHVEHPQNVSVARRLEAEFHALGDTLLEVELQDIPKPAVSNVRARLRGENSVDVLVVCAHFDSTVESGSHLPTSHAAPGADDNLSGVAAVLAAAETFCRIYSDTHRPVRTVEFVLFNAEESGLQGSRLYLNRLLGTEPCPTVFAALNIDMAATSQCSELFEAQAAGGTTPVAAAACALAGFTRAVAEGLAAAGALTQVKTAVLEPYHDDGPSINDGQSFRDRDVAACTLLERYTDADQNWHPTWHKLVDTCDHKDFHVDYATDLARILAATALRLADPR
jgi:hypothetical protein